QQPLRQWSARGKPGERKKLSDSWILLDFLVHLRLKRAHLRWRGAFLCDEQAANETAITPRYQCEWQMREEEPKTKNARQQDRHGQPRTIEKLIEQPTIGSNHTLDEIAGVPFHPSTLVARPALTKDASAHQRRERQGHEA